MKITQEWFDDLTILEKDFLRAYLSMEEKKINKDPGSTNAAAGLETVPERCPHCDGVRIIRHGHTARHIQRFRCKECGKTFSPCDRDILRAQ